MDELMLFFEVMLLFASIFATSFFLYKWYSNIVNIFNPKTSSLSKFVLFLVPFVCFLINVITITTHASYDVVNSGFYILLYILLGFAWLFLGEKLLFYFFDISVVDDCLHNNNQATLFPAVGGMIGLALIYAGANIGDGPGFWCVLIAGGIGVFFWIFLAIIINYYTKVIERFLISRDLGSGIRFGGYLIASGLILARASGGDWFGLIETITDFVDGWVVIPISLIYMISELYYKNKFKKGIINSKIRTSIIWSIALITVAILALIFIVPAFRENPFYG